MKSALSGKVAIITGANHGFGLALAKEFIEQGASIALCARDGDLLEKVGSELMQIVGENQKMLALVADVSKANEVDALVHQVIQQLGRIDILINNAGVYGPMGALEDVEWQNWVQAIEINLFGSILMCRAVLPYFKEQRAGKIIQLSGGGATNPMPCLSAYAVSKAALLRFVETLAEEVREFGIDVNAIAPGALNTRLLEEVLQAGPEKVGEVFFQKSLQQKESGALRWRSGLALPFSWGPTQAMVSPAS